MDSALSISTEQSILSSSYKVTLRHQEILNILLLEVGSTLNEDYVKTIMLRILSYFRKSQRLSHLIILMRFKRRLRILTILRGLERGCLCIENGLVLLACGFLNRLISFDNFSCTFPLFVLRRLELLLIVFMLHEL